MSHDASLPTRPGIANATLQRLGIRSVSPEEAKSLVGQSFAGLFIPYGLRVQGRPFGRLRLNTPQSDRKYTQAVGSGVHPYIPDFPALFAQQDLVIVEGEFKSIALCEGGFRAIGISGFYGFMHEEQLCPRLVNHLADHPCRRLLFLGDTDTALNYQFSDAAVKLARLRAPAPVFLPRIPWNMPKGVDDCREHLGEAEFGEWWMEIVGRALEVPAKLEPGLLAVELFKEALPWLRASENLDRALVLHRLGKLAGCLTPIALGELAQLTKKTLGISHAMLKQTAKSTLKKALAPFVPKEDWQPVIDAYGVPVFQGGEHEAVVGLNERFWAGLVASQNELIYEPMEKRFYRYHGQTGLWRSETEPSMEQLSCKTVGSETQFREDCLELTSMRFAKAVVGHLKGICEKAHVFAQTPLGIHAANGFLVIGEESMELQEFSPSHFSRNSSPIVFAPAARCPVFLEKVLRPVLDEDDISLLQYYAGQCLLGRNLTQSILILHGEGGTGKGTTSNVIQKLVGVHNCQELRTDHLEERFEIYRYIGRSLLYGADVDPGFLRTKGAHSLKRIVGNDLLTPEGKNSNEVFNIRGDFNVLITCNNRLSVRLSGDVNAWRRRLQIIEFRKPLEKTSVIRDLDSWLIENEGPGILNWAIVGASEVLADAKAGRARALSASQTRRLEALLGMSDSIRCFLTAKVEKRVGECLEKNELLEAYADYCGEQMWDPLPEMAARKELNNRMLEMFGSVERKSAGAERNQRGYSNVAFID